MKLVVRPRTNEKHLDGQGSEFTMSNDKPSDDTIGLLVHSYNNFLSGILGFAELAQLECKQDEVNEKIDLALMSGREAVNFGNQLLSSVGRLQVAFESCPLVPLLENISHSKNITVVSDKQAKDISVRTDAAWFSWCIKTLLKFCEIYSPQTPLSFVVETNHLDNLKVALKTPNLKLNEEQQSRLFDPFYTSRYLLGTKDVGLASIAGFCKQMGGQITWHQEVGFILDLPIATEARS